jgi:hypothetical protein
MVQLIKTLYFDCITEVKFAKFVEESAASVRRDSETDSENQEKWSSANYSISL